MHALEQGRPLTGGGHQPQLLGPGDADVALEIGDRPQVGPQMSRQVDLQRRLEIARAPGEGGRLEEFRASIASRPTDIRMAAEITPDQQNRL
ncbi:hypothetical protein BJ978_000351 [Agromyces terreus]|uniref:Uncharacterized protein n=1 Tax=Agromyces terreus TaxID=424795 RepID=A0A9X2GVC3_9MICO|nr:hypothetical protein [Agromyces terreus]MCP2369675.1 hypothetical protein [Agromyces terreus]